jgi:hypothetical protein
MMLKHPILNMLRSNVYALKVEYGIQWGICGSLYNIDFALTLVCSKTRDRLYV